MSIFSKWGFSRREQNAIAFICLALLTGLAGTHIRDRMRTSAGGVLTHEDSLVIEKFSKYSESVKSEHTKALKITQSGGEDTVKYKPYYPININTAGISELERLPGIGPKTAAYIIKYREIHGRFHDIDSLINVKGIGSQKMSEIRNLITINIPEGEE